MRDKDRVVSGTCTCDHYAASMTRHRTRLWNTSKLYSRRPRVQEEASVRFANTKIDFKVAIN